MNDKQAKLIEAGEGRRGMINIEQMNYVDDKTGREIARFTPVLNPGCLGSGSLRFACFEAWRDDVAGCNDAEVNALRNAKQVLIEFAESVSY